MKYKSKYFSLMRIFLKKPMIKKFGKEQTKDSLNKACSLYKQMIEKTEDIGADNPMSGNIYLGYVFMAVCKAGDFSVNDFKEIINEFFNNKSVNKALSKSDLNNPRDMAEFKARIHKIQEWTDSHSEYANKTWDFNFDEKLHSDGFYYHFTRCPMEKFARENGYLDLLPLCCEMDHIVIEKRKAVLHREQTLATGGEMCDYWIVGDKTKNPV